MWAWLTIWWLVPGEYKLYKKNWKNGRISVVCALFILVRYMSVLALILNGVGFYVKTFNPASCKAFYYFPMFTKMFAGMASNGIIFSRTYAISHTRRTFISLWVLLVLLFPLQVLGNTYKRNPVVGTGLDAGNCQAKTTRGDFISAPYYYLANVIFDTVACTIASVSLLRRGSVNGNLGYFGKKVLKHGLLYAFASTLTNFLVTLALFEVKGVKTLGSFLSIGVTMILAQHLVLATSRLDGSSTQHSSEDSLSGTARDRSASRDVKNRRLTTIGGTLMNTRGTGHDRRNSVTVHASGTDSRIDRIELGGIRVQTDTEIYRPDLHRDRDSMEFKKNDTLTSDAIGNDTAKPATISSATTSVEDFVMTYDKDKKAHAGTPGSIV
ncbi:hypothetical protein FRC02_002621 [Tulasnella sp. 418]|nr:hypothetical protein FRC02_002621 [Tulasnella sp. 418]